MEEKEVYKAAQLLKQYKCLTVQKNNLFLRKPEWRVYAEKGALIEGIKLTPCGMAELTVTAMRDTEHQLDNVACALSKLGVEIEEEEDEES